LRNQKELIEKMRLLDPFWQSPGSSRLICFCTVQEKVERGALQQECEEDSDVWSMLFLICDSHLVKSGIRLNLRYILSEEKRSKRFVLQRNQSLTFVFNKIAMLYLLLAFFFSEVADKIYGNNIKPYKVQTLKPCTPRIWIEFCPIVLYFRRSFNCKGSTMSHKMGNWLWMEGTYMWILKGAAVTCLKVLSSEILPS
jgi:hypothetical protein